MISLAGLVNSYLRDFPWQAREAFRLLDKLDAMFSALLAEASMTERVRIKSLVEGTRVTVFDVRDEEEEDDDDDDDDDVDAEVDAEVGRWKMAAARVYERTLSLV